MRLDTIEKRLEYRAAIVPRGAVKVKPRGFDVEFYLYDRLGENKGRPYGAAYFRGTAAKPVWHYGFKDLENRDRVIGEEIAGLQAAAEREKAQGLERKKGHGLEVGHILVTCWGYDQTNREFYRVTKVPGPRVAIVERVASVSAGETGWMQGKVVPGEKVIGKPLKLVAHYGRVSPEGHIASLWDGRPVNWTGYA